MRLWGACSLHSSMSPFWRGTKVFTLTTHAPLLLGHFDYRLHHVAAKSGAKQKCSTSLNALTGSGPMALQTADWYRRITGYKSQCICVSSARGSHASAACVRPQWRVVGLTCSPYHRTAPVWVILGRQTWARMHAAPRVNATRERPCHWHWTSTEYNNTCRLQSTANSTTFQLTEYLPCSRVNENCPNYIQSGVGIVSSAMQLLRMSGLECDRL